MPSGFSENFSKLTCCGSLRCVFSARLFLLVFSSLSDNLLCSATCLAVPLPKLQAPTLIIKAPIFFCNYNFILYIGQKVGKFKLSAVLPCGRTETVDEKAGKKYGCRNQHNCTARGSTHIIGKDQAAHSGKDGNAYRHRMVGAHAL